YVDSKLAEAWSSKDTLTVEVTFSGKRDEYKLLAMNGRPTTRPYDRLGGSNSRGEFGAVLKMVFRPESAAQFTWERWTRLRGRTVHVFAYAIDEAHSSYTISSNNPFTHSTVKTGVIGRVYIDDETGNTFRITSDANRVPEGFRVVRAPGRVDYDFVDLGGKNFLLPRRGERGIVSRRDQAKNVIEFDNHRKFSSETSITFEKQ